MKRVPFHSHAIAKNTEAKALKLRERGKNEDEINNELDLTDKQANFIWSKIEGNLVRTAKREPVANVVSTNAVNSLIKTINGVLTVDSLDSDTKIDILQTVLKRFK